MTDAIMVPSCNRSGGSILRRRPLLSLLAILISLCIILSCTLWRKLNLQRYFGTSTRKQKIDVPIILSLNEEEEKGRRSCNLRLILADRLRRAGHIFNWHCQMVNGRIVSNLSVSISITLEKLGYEY